jgi:hypothetical protein
VTPGRHRRPRHDRRARPTLRRRGAAERDSALPPSDRAIRALQALQALGGFAPVELVVKNLTWACALAAARLAIDLSVLRGAVDHVELPDGRDGLRLVTEADRSSPAA